jgi:hypothetical protein
MTEYVDYVPPGQLVVPGKLFKINLPGQGKGFLFFKTKPPQTQPVGGIGYIKLNHRLKPAEKGFVDIGAHIGGQDNNPGKGFQFFPPVGSGNFLSREPGGIGRMTGCIG